jgi:hypothetical protein
MADFAQVRTRTNAPILATQKPPRHTLALDFITSIYKIVCAAFMARSELAFALLESTVEALDLVYPELECAGRLVTITGKRHLVTLRSEGLSE